LLVRPFFVLIENRVKDFEDSRVQPLDVVELKKGSLPGNREVGRPNLKKLPLRGSAWF